MLKDIAVWLRNVREEMPVLAEQVQSSPAVSVLGVTERDEYAALAKRIGASQLCAAPETDKFIQRVGELGLRIYDERSVKRYLDGVYGATPYGWRALRQEDRPCGSRTHRSGLMGCFLMDDGGTNGFGSERSLYISGSSFRWRDAHKIIVIGGMDEGLYVKPVPFPVLLTVETLATEFPDACFFVNDEARPVQSSLDPFLMVRFKGNQYIIERWDEPSFRA